MNTNAIRLGSLLYREVNGTLFIDSVTHLYSGFIGFEQADGPITVQSDQVHGVPLTEDWLLKMGFIYDILFEGDDAIYYLPGKNFQIDSKTLQPLDAGFPIASYVIEFVHQLQNLYFALMEKELEIKEG